VIDISLKINKLCQHPRKTKANDNKSDDDKWSGGTRTEHFLVYLSNRMDLLNKNNMKGQYLVMDNAPIHTSLEVCDLVESRGYKCLYPPPYSPNLNLIKSHRRVLVKGQGWCQAKNINC
jgi:hypothetical protein